VSATTASPEAGAPAQHHRSSQVALTLGALGIVFGDIGTSPLYAMHEVFAGPHPMTPDPTTVYGVVSLVFWALMIIVTIKYVSFIMRANNEGEGGIMALIALVQKAPLKTRRAKLGLMALGIFGASLFYGDGMITPAISVLSAVEGLEVAQPSTKDYIVPIALVVLTFLFVIQRFGTGAVGSLFGPVMLVWFATIAVLGLRQVVQHPAILRALSPSYAVSFIANDFGTAFLALGSVVLAVTGAEALYADMGHFGRNPIKRSWLILVLPALTFNYRGQGSLVLHTPSAVNNPFYLLAPDWFQVPLVILATVATVIASQAVISGAFSVTRQAVQLGYLPRLDIRHTSSKEIGQVYVPAVNWLLFVAVFALVIGFRSSSNLASAYGIAVTGTLSIDTILAFVVVRMLWKKPLWMVVLGGAGFLTVDLSFFAGNITKVFHGGWFPLVIAAIVFTTLTTWRRGRQEVAERMRSVEEPLSEFMAKLGPHTVRVDGTAIYLTATGGETPRALQHNFEHNHVLHRDVILATVRTTGVPRVADDAHLSVEDLSHGIRRVIVTYGFQEQPDLPRALAEVPGVDMTDISYFLNHVTLMATRAGGMRMWRKKLFVAIQRNAAGAARFFRIPSDRVVELGTQVEF
jgi:KUP system potassium uptake protein